MKTEYDFSKMKGRKNPYAKRLKQQITIRMGIDIIEYFKIWGSSLRLIFYWPQEKKTGSMLMKSKEEG